MSVTTPSSLTAHTVANTNPDPGATPNPVGSPDSVANWDPVANLNTDQIAPNLVGKSESGK
jgi:hypothetical protein